MIDFEPLPVAIRAHVTRDREPKRPRPHRGLGRRPQRALVFDCETTTDATQRLLFGAWRLYVDDQNADAGTTCQQEGIFYADDLGDTDPGGFATLAEYARTRRAAVAPGCRTRLWFMSRSEFVERVLWRSGCSDATTIVGYNLPFDLTRIALFASRGRGQNRGGLSLCLWKRDNGDENKFRPRIAIKAIDAHRNLIWFTHPRDAPDGFRSASFLDLHTHSFALTDKRGLSLEAACRHFGVDFAKADVTHGTITHDYIDYCRADVAATAALYRATALEQARHPINLASTATFSAASIGKAYLTALGIEPFSDREVFVDPEVAGWGMAAFYGGRSECRIRHTDVPVVYVDFASMYPTCNALMNTWPLLCSEHLTISDNTRQVKELLNAPDLRDRLFDPTMWPILHTLVEVEPNGATLPVRALYDGETWGIGVNPFHSDRPCWYSLADVLATRLLDGPTPNVLRAWRLEPTEPVDTLNTLDLLGEIPFNPKHDDLFATLVEQRHRVTNDPNVNPEQRAGLVAWLKVLANATGFGIFAEVQRRDTHQPVDTQIWSDTPPTTTTTTQTPEDPGPYCAPPIAACLTGAARLMLALLEHEVTTRNGTYAFCDTDSMAIVATPEHSTVACPGGPERTPAGHDAVTALSWDDVNTIVDKFTRLNPYNPEHFAGSILKIESENYDPHGQQHELRCWAISAKRYTLTTTDDQVAKASEHGLGHLLDPTGNNTNQWIQTVWHHLRHPNEPPPDWWDLPAVSKIAVTGPELLKWFRTINANKPYPEQIKPANFLLIAYPDPLNPTSVQPVAPFNRDPQQWTTAGWIDRHTGHPTRLRTVANDGQLRPGTVRVRTYGDIIDLYRTHPEPKSLNQNHEAMDPNATGQLPCRPIQATPIVRRIGKEAHDLERRIVGLTSNDVETHNDIDNEVWDKLTVEVLKTLPTSEVAAATRVHRRTVQRAITKQTVPRNTDRRALTAHATATARRHVETSRRSSDESVMARYVASQSTATSTHAARNDTKSCVADEKPQVTALGK